MQGKRGRPTRPATPEVTPRTLTARETAAYIGRTYDWFMRNRRQLEAERQFPAPLPGIRRYDRLAIDAWIDGQRQKAAQIRANVARHGAGGLLCIEDELARRAEKLARGLLP
jgi:hypothetical protein